MRDFFFLTVCEWFFCCCPKGMVSECACMCMWVCVYVCLYMCLCIHVYVCVCLYCVHLCMCECKGTYVCGLCVEGRGEPQVLVLAFHFVWDRVPCCSLPYTPGLMASQLLGIFLSKLPIPIGVLGYRCAHYASRFWVTDVHTTLALCTLPLTPSTVYS